MEANYKQLRKKYISREPFRVKLFIYLGVKKVWYEKRNNFPNDPWRCEKISLTNPISWASIIVLVIIAIVKFVITALIPEIVSECKKQRYG